MRCVIEAGIKQLTKTCLKLLHEHVSTFAKTHYSSKPLNWIPDWIHLTRAIAKDGKEKFDAIVLCPICDQKYTPQIRVKTNGTLYFEVGTFRIHLIDVHKNAYHPVNVASPPDQNSPKLVASPPDQNSPKLMCSVQLQTLNLKTARSEKLRGLISACNECDLKSGEENSSAVDLGKETPPVFSSNSNDRVNEMSTQVQTIGSANPTSIESEIELNSGEMNDTFESVSDYVSDSEEVATPFDSSNSNEQARKEKPISPSTGQDFKSGEGNASTVNWLEEVETRIDSSDPNEQANKDYSPVEKPISLSSSSSSSSPVYWPRFQIW
ncbi:uncharacterized protein LOC119074178 isoform X2 [Bradysia coprophila]|uniref:uncharacterized protein LOC119074178 isoform X2 n=1 Tax=Bradysia coprophila TaxID=38358 RepID=UPI00187D7635|nr:uncharacterized protein LOC119074178 isoform X2 [Bradysia coprophila]